MITDQPTPSPLPFVLPLRHDREEFADWGWIRDAAGEIIFQAKPSIPVNGPEANDHRREGTDPAQARVDALLGAFAIVQKLAEWSEKYPRQRMHSFSEKVDEQLVEIEDSAKAWLALHITPPAKP